MQYAFRDVRFIGGTGELGNDIEFHEIIGPDRHRFYSGIQVKKGDIGLAEATDLIRQGTQALEKDILDTSTGHKYRCGRWIIATTGQITLPAQNQIATELSRYGKFISFWDGIKLAELIQDYYYDEFIRVLGVDPIYAGSQNVRIHLFDPENPIELIKDFSSTEWMDISLADVIPPANTDAVFLAFYPHNGNLPGIEIAMQTAIDDLVIGSVMSQVNLIPLRIKKGQASCRVRLLQADQHVRIVSRGFRFTI